MKIPPDMGCAISKLVVAGGFAKHSWASRASDAREWVGGIHQTMETMRRETGGRTRAGNSLLLGQP